MPQMGESIAEGTIVRWIKKVGDKVDRDEPLFEISTDKVDAEIPAPAAGVVTEIRHKEGETVPVNTVVGRDRRGEPRRAPAPPSATPAAPVARSIAAAEPPRPRPPQPRRRTRLGRRRRRRDARSPASGSTPARTSASRPARRRRERHPPAIVAAGAQDREGTQRRYLADSAERASRAV